LAPLKSTTVPSDSGLRSESDNPFSTIESAQEFVKLLTKAVHDAKRELEASIESESGLHESRRLDAFQVALYSLTKLETHMHQSSRILNDLRTLRRLLLAKRAVENTAIASNASEVDEDASTEIKAQASLNRLPL
jgi:hypothetical protein